MNETRICRWPAGRAEAPGLVTPLRWDAVADQRIFTVYPAGSWLQVCFHRVAELPALAI